LFQGGENYIAGDVRIFDDNGTVASSYNASINPTFFANGSIDQIFSRRFDYNYTLSSNAQVAAVYPGTNILQNGVTSLKIVKAGSALTDGIFSLIVTTI
jgi:hypothetical protein